MKRSWLKDIRSLLKKGEIEDTQSALALASFHLNHSEHKESELELLIDGIKRNIPIPYVIGYTVVYGLKIAISKDVLNPGPETVTLIKKAVEHVNRSSFTTILDLCTGSGAVGVSLAKKCNAKIVATDISETALKLAKFNASQNKVDINFLHGNLFEPVNGMVFDTIVTNPPYVKSASINLLPGYVRNFAPLAAIDGGEDGLFFHKTILSKAKDFLKSGGSLFIECEDDQDGDVEEIATMSNWKIKERFSNRYKKIRGFRLT